MPTTAPRPAPATEPLPALGSFDTPIVALFDTAASASVALQRAGVTLWREASPGVVAMAPHPGLREQLYAAGAMLVVG
ncbi:hypothetical protein ACFOD4_16055 [Pseudoroseomonas globiformis]|uniref:Uncharacterized protein n=1 Tax=Teichococcus globiformis TaxID=2307229 RepID=A0ABV7G4W4_9PROT